MKSLVVALLFAAPLLVGTARAESPADPCTGFTWPMSADVAAANAAPTGETSSGMTNGFWPEGAIRLSLTTGEEKTFPVPPPLPVPPERAPTQGTTSSYITLPAPPQAGTYQISLGGKAWIDVIQNGKAVKSGAHTSDKTCDALHKSVRFDLVAAPVILQISGSDATSIVLTIMPASN